MEAVEAKSVGTATRVVPQADPRESPRAEQAVEAKSQWMHIWTRRQLYIAGLASVGIALHLVLRFAVRADAQIVQLPLIATLALGGMPLVIELTLKLARRQFGSDLLAGISIVTSVVLGQYLAGALVVLMLSGGEALEAYAIASASSVLRALARRMPSMAHRMHESELRDVQVEGVAVGDALVVFPHEICPVDGVIVEGRGAMDESYLTGEPFQMSKTPGSEVLSGSINGENALTIRATKLAVDSRYARIMQVMRTSERERPHMRRLADQLGAFYTPVALAIALLAWLASGHPTRFLAVLVVATPCPLLIAIPVAIIGAISLCARRGIIVKKPAVLEQVDRCRTIIFDKTGTLTYGEPRLSKLILVAGFAKDEVLALTASVERYSKHPLARAVLMAAADAGLALHEATRISEPPGAGLGGVVAGKNVQITSRRKLATQRPELVESLPANAAGLECIVLIDDAYAATFQFRDEPRADGLNFVRHLAPMHRFGRLMLVSGDRESEVRHLARRVGIQEVYSEQSPEQKLRIVQDETRKAQTLYLGDGINDAPALTAATVGVALGQGSDITSEAAGAVILDSSLTKVDEFFHISRRMRRIALQSAVGGMALSVAGMLLASIGYLPPVAGAVLQEVIDLAAVANALRAAWRPKALTDLTSESSFAKQSAASILTHAIPDTHAVRKPWRRKIASALRPDE
jgi:heavy metal translocating P-type ATPase